MRLAAAVGLTLPCICGLGAASEAYTVPYHGIDAAGGRAASGDYAVVGVLGGVGGLGVGRPDEAALRAGFAGQLNEPPTTSIDTVSVFLGEELRVALTTLLANDHDVEGEALTIVSVNGPTAGGGVVRIEGDTIVYTPPPESFDDDTFDYVVMDAFGGTAIGTVVVNVVPSMPTRRFRGVSLTGSPDNPQVNIEASGIPGRRYGLQMTASLTAPIMWSNLGGTQAAPADGQLSFTDPAPESPRFYRMIEIP